MFLQGVHIHGQKGVFDLTLRNGVIASRQPSHHKAVATVLPLLVDAHVHLDKTGTIQRTGPSHTGLMGAIDLMRADQALWTAEDIGARALQALKQAYANGTGALRTHVDWSEAAVPLAWTVIGALAEDWKERVHVERAALVPIDCAFTYMEDVARAVAEEAQVLGAFVRLNDDLEKKLSRMFTLAERYDLRLDFHVDEVLDKRAKGFELIVAETLRRGMKGRVVCGHCCSLTLQLAHRQQDILAKAAQAGISLISLPTSNLFLQDRHDQATPLVRGITNVREAFRIGANTCIASDNCADPFYPFGNYDLLSVARLTTIAAHLDPVSAVEAITAAPRLAMALHLARLEEGQPADFLVLGAASLTEALNEATPKWVVRGGTVLAAEAPDLASICSGAPDHSCQTGATYLRTGQAVSLEPQYQGEP